VAHWPIQSRAAELGRLLFAMLAPQCCALVIAPARKDRVDGSPRPSGLNDNHVASDRPSIGRRIFRTLTQFLLRLRGFC
jgi:hypothetical protein